MTMNDVAKLANVSSATVSRVINSSGPVSSDTVERVKRAISEIGYVPKPPLSPDRVHGSKPMPMILLEIACRPVLSLL
jgi:LacI family sucrose operon transcriptional repressor